MKKISSIEKRFLLTCEQTGQKTKLKKGDLIIFHLSDPASKKKFTLVSLFRLRFQSRLLWPKGDDDKIEIEGVRLTPHQCFAIADMIGGSHGLSVTKHTHNSSHLTFKFT